jgi:exodeoxyribonuclease VII small subunit
VTMAEETYGFEQARVRLEEIAAQVKRKDTSLEKSLDLLEEGVRLANQCTEQIDHTQWKSAVSEPSADGEPAVPAEAPVSESGPDAAASGSESGSAVFDHETCDAGAAGFDADADVPAEDAHGASEDAPAEDPDVEA